MLETWIQVPGLGRSPGEGNGWLPTPVFFPGEFHGQRSLLGYSPWGHNELDRTVGLSLLLDYRSICLVAGSLCPLLPLQSLLPKSAIETLQTLNQITSFPRLKSPNVFPLYLEPSLQFDFISCPLSLAL